MGRDKHPDALKTKAHGVGAYPATWERWDSAAAREGKTRQQWIRDVLTAAAEQSERRQRRSVIAKAKGDA